GTYTLTETNVPGGYEKATDIEFTVDKDGKVTVGGENVNGTVTMVDKYSNQTVKVSKTDINGEEIAGAELKITKKGDTSFEAITWTSEEGKTKEVSLQPGTYILTETTRPDGYVKAESITFTVDKDGNVKVDDEKVDQVTMTDDYSSASFRKTDLAGEELKDAKLEITDRDGKPVKDVKGNSIASWISDGENAHVVDGILDGIYKLTEMAAPETYDVAESIIFEIKDGKVAYIIEMIDGEEVHTPVADNTIIMKDRPIGSLNVKKFVIAAGTAVSDVFHITLFKDSNYTEPVATKDLWVYRGVPVNKDGLTFDRLDPGTYYVAETDAAGHPIGADGSTFVQTYVTYSNTIKVGDGEALSGADAGYGVSDVTQGGTTNVIVTNIPQGVAPEGFGQLTVTKEVKDTENNDEKVSKSFYVGLFDADGKAALDARGNVIAVQELKLENSSTTTTTFKALDPTRVYYVQETDKNGNIMKSTDINFAYEIKYTQIENDETIESEAIQVVPAQPSAITITNTEKPRYETNVSKTDINGEEIAGAVLTITKHGETAPTDTWTSVAGETHVTHLQPGVYVLSETNVPGGYVKATDIEFTVDADGNVTVNEDSVDKVTMVDQYSTAVFSKTDVAGNELAGATLKITDENGKPVHDFQGNEIKSWVSDGTTHTVTGLPDGDYVFTEISAPNGYAVAESIRFTMKDGRVAGTTDNIVTMVDKPIGSLNVKKSVVGTLDDKEISDTFYVTLFADADHTKKVGKTQAMEIKDGRLIGDGVTFEGLTPGTYYVAETDKNGTPLGLDGESFDYGYVAYTNEITGDANAAGVVNVAQGKTAEVTVTNKPEGYTSLAFGELTVTKYVKDSAKNDKKVSATFYAGLFDKDGKRAVDGNGDEIAVKELKLDNTNKVSVQFKDLDPETVYYVQETDKDGKILSSDTAGFGYTIQIGDGKDGANIVKVEEEGKAEIAITNTEKASTEKTGTPGTTGNSNSAAAKTGDKNTVMGYVIAMLLALGVVVVAIRRRRRA
ncbi:MSCRAMM family protein, partial [Hespellia stercorisuis]